MRPDMLPLAITASSEAAPKLPKCGTIASKNRDPAQIRPSLTEVGSHTTTNVCRMWPNSGELWPDSANLWPNLTDVGRRLPFLRENWQNFVQVQPELADLCFCCGWVGGGADVCRICPKAAEVGRISPHVAALGNFVRQLLHNFGPRWNRRGVIFRYARQTTVPSLSHNDISAITGLC